MQGLERGMTMKKLILWTITTTVLMIGCPWLTATLAGKNGMLISMLLFFAINPTYSAIGGYVAGKKAKKLWAMPLITSILYITGVWLFYDMGEMIFLIYGLAYLIIGYIAMIITARIRNNQEKSRQS